MVKLPRLACIGVCLMAIGARFAVHPTTEPPSWTEVILICAGFAYGAAWAWLIHLRKEREREERGDEGFPPMPGPMMPRSRMSPQYPHERAEGRS